jgi:carbon storage regulator
MLVLSRKSGESIVIGDDIRVTVVAVEGNRLRLGIEAPRECRILRGEIKPWDENPRGSDVPADKTNRAVVSWTK